MHLSLLSTLSVALKPVVFVPGTCGTMLRGSAKRKDFWYCPKMKDTTIYLNNLYIVPPLYNCMLAALELEYDKDTNYYKNSEGVSLEAIDWGGTGGFQFGDVIPKHPAFTYFGDFIRYLQLHGYETKKNIFGAPFDWRYGPNMPQSFWTNLSLLVEQAYAINLKSRVVLIGHSLGGFIIQRFLTKHTTAAWRATYIDSAVLSAPSFGGAGLAFSALVTGTIPLLSWAISGRVSRAVRSIGALHAQLPNHEIFGNMTIGIDSNGEKLRASDYPRVLEEHGFVDKDEYALSKNEPSAAPEAPDVPIAIVYNSGISTVQGYDLQQNNYTYGRGDLVVNAEGPEYACRNWKKAKVVCIDIEKADYSYNHLGVTILEDVVRKTMKFVLDDSWQK